MDPSIGFKLLLAAVLGGIIGVEREIRDKPAGLRTNILICVGSTLFMSISTQVANLLGGDPTRIAAQIISGIGFLGAGAVLQSHGFVLGLTTAATIWVVAGVGMALGSGMYGVAVFTTAMSLVTLYFLSFLEDRIQGRKSYHYSLIVTDLNQALTAVNKVLQDNSVSAVSFNFKKRTGHYRVWFNLVVPRDKNLKILQGFSEVPEITQVETGAGVRDFAQVRAADRDEVDSGR
ncbi:MAG: MgtC/SapB family protein [Acidobacteria bacterium]|nr:MgtC/SapB family protein [Acidobacteriota bacterium]